MNSNFRLLYRVIMNVVPFIFIIWLSYTVYHHYITHDPRFNFTLGLFMLAGAMWLRQLIFMYQYGWDWREKMHGQVNQKHQAYIFAAIVAVLIVINLIAIRMS